MAVQAKYLFDQDFAPDAKSAEKAMAPAELAIMLAEAESKSYRDGFAAAEKEGTAVATRRMAVAFEQIGDVRNFVDNKQMKPVLVFANKRDANRVSSVQALL